MAGNLDFVLGSSGVPKHERAKRIGETLRLVRIESYAHRYPSNLSGSEQQRVAIALALVGSPRLLLRDKPMSSLESPLKAELSPDLIELQRLLRVTTVYITHDRIEAMAVAHRIAIMQKGHIEQVGAAEPLRSQPATETVAVS